jgi:hypothetical protein
MEKAKRKLSWKLKEAFRQKWQLPKGANVQNRKELNEGTGQTKVEARPEEVSHQKVDAPKRSKTVLNRKEEKPQVKWPDECQPLIRKGLATKSGHSQKEWEIRNRKVSIQGESKVKAEPDTRRSSTDSGSSQKERMFRTARD